AADPGAERNLRSRPSRPKGYQCCVRRGSEEAVARVVHTAECVVVDGHTGDAPVGGQSAGLRADLLSSEHSFHRSKLGVTVEQVEIPGELFNAIDFTATFDLDSDRHAGVVAAQQIDRTDGRRI